MNEFSLPPICLTLPRNRFDQHFGDFVLNVCENIIDQLKVKAEAKLKTLCRRRPLGVKLVKSRSRLIDIASFAILPVGTVPFEECFKQSCGIENKEYHRPCRPREGLKKCAE